MSSTALSTAGRFPVRRKRPNRPSVDNASRLLASTKRVPVQCYPPILLAGGRNAQCMHAYTVINPGGLACIEGKVSVLSHPCKLPSRAQSIE